MKRALALIAAGALLAASCGADGSVEAVAQAAENVRDEGTANVSFTSTMTLPEEAGGGELTASGEGALDYQDSRGRLTLSFEGTGQAGQMSETLGEIESLYEGSVIYMRWPLLTQMLGQFGGGPEPTEWFKMDLDEIGEELGFDFGQLMQIGQNDPFQGVEYLRGAEDVEEVGTEEIDGVRTTHYAATIDFDTLAEELEGEQGESIRKVIELTSIEEVGAEVWIDSDDLIRRVAYDFGRPPMAGLEEMEDGGFVMQMDFSDYGIEVDIELPADDDVTDLGELLRQQQG